MLQNYKTLIIEFMFVDFFCFWKFTCKCFPFFNAKCSNVTVIIISIDYKNGYVREINYFVY